MDEISIETRNPVCQAVRRLRLALDDTQQQFATRLHLAISTVVRYELSRPPRGKALVQLDRLAMEHGFDDCALIFRNALLNEAGVRIPVGDARPPQAASVGFETPWPKTPEEEAMVADVLTVMREALDSKPAPNSYVQESREQSKQEMKLLLKATKRARAERVEGVEFGQAQWDKDAAIVRLSKLGMTASEIAEQLKTGRYRDWTSGKPVPRVEAVLAAYKKNASERK
jgi:transcriptional regulator with XRE-family HTH domain